MSEKFDGQDQIHLHRMEGDPIYHLLFFPRHQNFAQQYFDKCMELVHKKYGSAIKKDSIITEMTRLLRTIYDDEAHVMVIMFMIAWEPEVQKATEQLYTLHPNTVFGTKSKEHFRAFVWRLNQFVLSTINFAYNIYNIIETAKNFREACQEVYMLE